MTVATSFPIYYPSGDGQPVAETFAHLYAILMTIELLRLNFDGQRVSVLGNQFLYYEPGQPSKRVAPDVFVIFNVEPGGRDNYKIWEEGSVPSIAFEMTSPSTKKEDDGSKKQLYAQIGIQEYWQFDPKGEWIAERLRGYSLEQGVYQPIANGISQVLGLRLAVTEELHTLISFYRLDSGEKLLLPAELKAGMMLAKQEAKSGQQQAESAQQQAESAQQEANRLAAKLAEYEARFGSLEN